MTTSRGVEEQVRFSRDTLMSTDWVTYPIVEMRDTPEEIDVVLLDHNEPPPYDAGEAATRAAALASAAVIRDAYGIRARGMRSPPENIRPRLPSVIAFPRSAENMIVARRRVGSICNDCFVPCATTLRSRAN